MGVQRTVSVLVTDLAGSTELRVRLGEDRAQHLQRRHDALLTTAVTDAGGTVVKGLGDGVLATFESAADALTAAVEIQRAARAHNRRAPDEELGIRCGISVGDVSIEGDDCFGTPVVEAARLCAAADAAEIVVADLVRVLARGRGGHRFVAERSLELKGLPEPMPVVSVEWKPADDAPTGHLPPALAGPFLLPFHGRDDELARLVTAWERAATGATEAVLLAGEPGIGKTRLSAELALRVTADGGAVLYGHCDEGMVVPYLPFVEALRQQVDGAGPPLLGARPGELVRLVPELAVVAGVSEPSPAVDPETDRYRLYDAVASWLGAVAAKAPTLFVVDDLHWADRATLLLLRHVVASAGVRGLLVVGTYRDTDVDRTHPLGELLADLRRRDRVERIALDGLDRTEVAELVEGTAGHDLDQDGRHVAEVVWSGTDGNPFFVQQVLQHLVETGVLAQRDGRWQSTVSLDDIGIPEGVRDVVGRRLSRLSESANQLLAGAAVAGPMFELELLAAAADVSVDTAIDDLDAALAAGLVRESGAGAYRFTHALLRSTLYEELSATRRARWHRRLAEALEARVDPEPGLLAHHWARAGTDGQVVARALTVLRDAAEDAMVRVAPDEAAHHLRTALAVADDADVDDDGWRLETLIRLGEAQRHAGDPAHRESLLQAGDLAAARGDVGAMVRAALANQRAIYAAMFEVDAERVAALERALRAVGDDDLAARAELLTRLAVEQSYGLDVEDRLPLVAEAVDLAATAGDRRALAAARFALSYTSRPLPIARKVESWQEVVALNEGLPDPAPLGFAQIYLAMTATDRGDHGLADEATDAAVQLGEDTAHPTIRWRAAVWLAARALIAGRPREGLVLGERACDIGVAGGQGDAARMFGPQRTSALVDLGMVGPELLDGFRRAFPPGLPGMHCLASHLLAELGDLSGARAELQELSDKGWPLQRDPGWQPMIAPLVLAIGAVGDPAFTQPALEWLAPYADVGVLSDVAPACDLATAYGILLLTAGDLDAAIVQLERADGVTVRVGAPGWRARTRLHLARALLRRDRPGDGERAEELLRVARDGAAELGLTAIERQAAAVLSGAVPA